MAASEWRAVSVLRDLLPEGTGLLLPCTEKEERGLVAWEDPVTVTVVVLETEEVKAFVVQGGRADTTADVSLPTPPLAPKPGSVCRRFTFRRFRFFSIVAYRQRQHLLLFLFQCYTPINNVLK